MQQLLQLWQRFNPATCKHESSETASQYPGLATLLNQFQKQNLKVSLFLSAQCEMHWPIPGKWSDFNKVAFNRTSPSLSATTVSGSTWDWDELCAAPPSSDPFIPAALNQCRCLAKSIRLFRSKKIMLITRQENRNVVSSSQETSTNVGETHMMLGAKCNGGSLMTFNQPSNRVRDETLVKNGTKSGKIASGIWV